MGSLEIWLKEACLKKFGTAEIRKEVYILCMGIDQSLVPQNIAEEPASLISDTFKKYNRYSIVSVSPVFRNIKRGDKLSLHGDGLLLYGPKDPGGKVALHCAIMESDDAARNFSKKLEDGIKHSGLFGIIDGALSMGSLAAPQIAVITAAARFAFETVTYFLKEEGDDVISTFHYSSTFRKERGGYAQPPEGTFFEHSDRYVDVHFDTFWRK